ncbi:MAG: amino acid--tRNA ligase-related protein, partial [Stellaceae bacterium]
YVPSRLHPGQFYALPQAPQQFKQLLMVAGFDRYFQIAPCFRDEASRADRSPGEFYQLDFEMSFVTQEDVFAAIEPVLHGVFGEFAGGRAVSPAPFRRISYADAMLRYASDKPDLRNPIEISDATETFRGSGFEIFARMIAADDNVRVRAIPAPGGGSRAFCDRMNSWAQSEGQPGLGYIMFYEETVNTPGSVAEAVADAQETHGLGPKNDVAHLRYLQGRGPIARRLSVEAIRELAARCNLKAGDAVFFVAGVPKVFAPFANAARLRIGRELNLTRDGVFEFCWITDFPMYEMDEESGHIEFSHNPFSMPQGGLEALETKDPLSINAYQYDIVCNGVELSSGAIRNHRPDIMYKAFAIAGYSAAEV